MEPRWLLVAMVLPGCRAPSLGIAPSLLPSVGLAAAVAVPLDEGPWSIEVRVTDQFLDDKAFADDGNPEAGDWTQLDLGCLWHVPGEGRSWSARFGLTGFEARGDPNLAEEPGTYVGLYAGIGRWTWLWPGWLFGPELTLLVATGPDERVVIPQLTWGLRWIPGHE